MKLARGSVILVELDPTRGHEQRGARPCIVVSDHATNREQRYPLIAVVPVTRTPGRGILYPPLAKGKSGLTSACFALIDHVRAVDRSRVRRLWGAVQPKELEAIDEGLLLFLGLESGRQP
jgi:mRNA interferase MazF